MSVKERKRKSAKERPRQGFGGPNYPRHPSQVAVLQPSLPKAKRSATGVSGVGCDRALLGGGGV